MKEKILCFFKNNSHPLKLLAGAFIISFSAVYVKVAKAGPDVIGFYRNFLSIFIFIPILIFKKEKIFLNKNILIMIIAGFMLFVDFYFWHRSIFLIGPGMATLLGNFQVFFMGIFSVLLFKERLSYKYYISIIISIGGLYLLTGAGSVAICSSSGKGILYGLITAVMYAAYLIFFKKGQQKDPQASQFSNLLLVYISVSILFFLVILIKPGDGNGLSSLLISDGPTWVALICSALFSSFLGWYLISSALPGVRVAIAGLMLLLQPVFSYLWDILFFNKDLKELEAAGALIALVAIYFGIVKGRSKS